MNGLGAASSISPWGALGNTLAAAASTPTSSATGKVENPITVGGIDFAGGGVDHTITLAALGAAVVLLGLIAMRRKG